MSAHASTLRNNQLFVLECACASKHRFLSLDKTAGEGVTCQGDGRYRNVGSVIQGDSETYVHAKYRALLTQFEMVN